MPKGPPRKRRPLLVLDFEEGSGGLRLAFGCRGRFWRLRGFALAILLVDHALSRMERGLVGFLDVSGEPDHDIFEPHE